MRNANRARWHIKTTISELKSKLQLDLSVPRRAIAVIDRGRFPKEWGCQNTNRRRKIDVIKGIPRRYRCSEIVAFAGIAAAERSRPAAATAKPRGASTKSARPASSTTAATTA